MSPRHRCSHAAQGVNPQDSDQVITTATEDQINAYRAAGVSHCAE
jgi:hypothetical protein